MIILTQSLLHFLEEFHRDLIIPLGMGHIELFTPEVAQEYLEWCATDDGKQYLQGGAKCEYVWSEDVQSH